MLQHHDVLGLFAKWPSAGTVKTRLAAATSPEFAARVAAAFLRDSLQHLAKIQVRRIIAFAPIEWEREVAGSAAPAWELTSQRGADLGERLASFFADQFAAGARRIVVVGADSPTLPIEYIRGAFELLADHDVVIGPATDGGYYLIALRQPLPELFAGIRWSGSDVLQQTVSRLGAAKLALLPPWYDVDTLNDWHMLRGHLTALRRAGIDPHAPNSEAIANESLTPPA